MSFWRKLQLNLKFGKYFFFFFTFTIFIISDSLKFTYSEYSLGRFAFDLVLSLVLSSISSVGYHKLMPMISDQKSNAKEKAEYLSMNGKLI